MKTRLFFSAALFGSLSLYAQPEQETTKDYELMGPVESCKTTFASIGKKPQDRFEMGYGNDFDKEGRVSGWSFDLGFLGLMSNGTYIRDEQGKIIEERQASDEGSTLKASYTYDDNNLLVEYISFYSDSTIDSKNTMTYNDQNQLIKKETYYGESEEISVTYKYEYDSRGFLKEAVEDWGYTIETYRYAYDNEGNETEVHYTTTNPEDEGKSNYSSFTEYDADGRWVKSVNKNYKGQITSYSTREFDKEGRQTFQYNYSPKGKVTSYTVFIEYDRAGNWIESVTYSGKKITSAESRRISYY